MKEKISMNNVIKDLDIVKSKLNKSIGKSIEINQNGFLETKFMIQEMNYGINQEKLSITNKDKNSYICININQIYKIEFVEEKILLYMDNDTVITLKQM